MEKIMKNEKLFQCECSGNVIKEYDSYKCQKCDLIVYEKFMGQYLSIEDIKRLFYGNGFELSNIDATCGKKYNIQVFYNNGEISLEYI